MEKQYLVSQSAVNAISALVDNLIGHYLQEHARAESAQSSLEFAQGRHGTWADLNARMNARDREVSAARKTWNFLREQMREQPEPEPTTDGSFPDLTRATRNAAARLGVSFDEVRNGFQKRFIPLVPTRTVEEEVDKLLERCRRPEMGWYLGSTKIEWDPTYRKMLEAMGLEPGQKFLGAGVSLDPDKCYCELCGKAVKLKRAARTMKELDQVMCKKCEKSG